ncbi:hypothetical protein BCR33DRAFT_582630 [Rhizoclosmatium globosum]|uniref:Zn(2)-C6 fungal-type domain-containing protein n=1 Tax=Rhizoclosmatium globosum TaxID=329046 RepID=A0A1Y2CSR8_9FUNG|nr:hypothetical protein BCR33DRAFT_582630 [Rhizoclosmatium globosum]|eukprot:ORY49425.1 hypothetical protein BCR33DRAFT_582630 [Rhizoclosmatium globosum]
MANEKDHNPKMQVQKHWLTTACTGCRRLKRKCQLKPGSSACVHCEKRGRADTCDALNLDVAPPPKSCARCIKYHKKCVPGAFGCVLCMDLGLECAASSPKHPESPIAAKLERRNLSQSSAESSLTLSTPLEDTDLFPTVEDQFMVINFFNSSLPNVAYLTMNILDKESIISSFFSTAPALRLVVCAIAAYYANPPLPDMICHTYYQRARKAIMLAADTASISTIQACLAIYNFAIWRGHPLVAQTFFRLALDMAVALKLYVDPDDSLGWRSIT